MSQDGKPYSADDQKAIWGNNCLPVVLDALGKSIDDIKGVRLHFEIGSGATATYTNRSGRETMARLPNFRFDLPVALGALRGVQAMTIHIAEENFVTIECRYFPLGATADDIVAMLRADR